MRDINLETITNQSVRDALEAIKEILTEDSPLLKGDWIYYEVEVNAAGTHERDHGLTYTPKDYLITFDTAGSSINYADANDETFSFTTTSSGILRLFLGRYSEESRI